MIPVTTNFDNSLDSTLGHMVLSDEALKEIHGLIEAGVIPTFAVGFTGTPNEDGIYTNVKLVEVSMLTHPQEEE